jgi:hypothetical protein
MPTSQLKFWIFQTCPKAWSFFIWWPFCCCWTSEGNSFLFYLYQLRHVGACSSIKSVYPLDVRNAPFLVNLMQFLLQFKFKFFYSSSNKKMNLLTCQSCQQVFFGLTVLWFLWSKWVNLKFPATCQQFGWKLLLRAPARLFFSCQAPRMCAASTFDLLGQCKAAEKCCG